MTCDFKLIEAAQIVRHKNFLRGFYRHAVLTMPWERRHRLAGMAARRLAALPVFREAQTVGLYVAVGGEIEIVPLFNLCRKAGKSVAVPVIFPEKNWMEYSLLDGPVRWDNNVYGIPEPSEKDRRLLDSRNVELAILPGRAFSPDGVRLGAGGGYYDRFLERHPKLTTVALSFDEQISPTLPAGPHDVRLDWVVTPTRTFHPK